MVDKFHAIHARSRGDCIAAGSCHRKHAIEAPSARRANAGMETELHVDWWPYSFHSVEYMLLLFFYHMTAKLMLIFFLLLLLRLF